RRMLRRLKKKKAELAAMGFDYSLDIGSLEHRWIKKEEPKDEMPEEVGETPAKSDPKGDATEEHLKIRRKREACVGINGFHSLGSRKWDVVSDSLIRDLATMVLRHESEWFRGQTRTDIG
uniref:Uncharacterized protein n=1 Tax=Parascaris univalens TaxID=6257 RepID=A0A915CGF0_PARUN